LSCAISSSKNSASGKPFNEGCLRQESLFDFNLFEDGTPMKAMILAAGLGTRLRPLTDNRPKALVELYGRTLLEITLTHLRTFGVTEVIINVHHFADMVIDYLKSNKNFGMRIEVSREEVLLDTGGGLKKAAWFFLEDSTHLDEPFLLHNVDVVSNIDLRLMLQFHIENRALATLAVQDRETSRYLLFDDHNELRGRRIESHSSLATRLSPLPEAPAPSPLQALAFSGIHIISPRLLPMLTEEGIFSIIRSYLRLAAQGEKVLAFRADQYYWRDLGRPADLAQAAQDLQQNVFL
jgi:mannose-1-phosphate guanylyltransferase